MRQSAPGTKGWDIDLGHGLAGESELLRIVQGRVEVKRDRQAYFSGNVVVEYEYRSRPSGIATTTAGWWAFIIDSADGKMNSIVLTDTARLKKLARRAYALGRIVAGGDDGESMMVQVKLSDLYGYTGRLANDDDQEAPPHAHAGVRRRNARRPVSHRG